VVGRCAENDDDVEVGEVGVMGWNGLINTDSANNHDDDDSEENNKECTKRFHG